MGSFLRSAAFAAVLGPMTQLETRTEPMVVHFGPTTPRWHECLRLVVNPRCEDRGGLRAVIGYLHPRMEKIARKPARTWMFVPYVSRWDYAAGNVQRGDHGERP